MKVLSFSGRKLTQRTMPVPRRKRGEALVKVHLAGICATDLEIMRGYMDFRGIPGHEFVGTVVSARSKKLKGRRVVGEINIPCGRCNFCRRGLGKHCPKRTVLGIEGRNGAFAEYLTLPEVNLHTVPAKVSDEEAVFTEPLAAACEIPLRTNLKAGSTVAVLGDGRLAAMAAQVAAMRTKRVEVLGMNPVKLAAFRALGMPALELKEPRRFKRKFDVVIECTGSPKGLSLAAELVRPQGTIVLKSTYHGRHVWNPSPLVVDEITVVGSRCGPFDTALRLLAMDAVNVKPFLTAIYPLSGWKSAFRRAKHRDSFKVLLRLP